jgi:hypothetical protein
MQLLERHSLFNPGVKLANCSFHRELQEQGLYADILGGLERVALITCRNVIGDVWRTFGVKSVKWYVVPEEANTGGKPTKHYPEVYDSFHETLRAVEYGDLALVGAGALGKIYCQWLKESGAVAVDIGSIFDGWAGVMSRSYIVKEPHAYAL